MRVWATFSKFEKDIWDLKGREEDLKEDAKEKKQWYDGMVDEPSEDNAGIIEILCEYNNARHKLEQWRDVNALNISEMQDECKTQPGELKALCATVINEYSTKCLQDDFKDGLKAMYHTSDEDGDHRAQNPQVTTLPDDFETDVHCISSNDYLKIQGIQPKSDGPPSTVQKLKIHIYLIFECLSTRLLPVSGLALLYHLLAIQVTCWTM